MLTMMFRKQCSNNVLTMVTSMVQLRLMVMSLVLQLLSHKPKYWTDWYFNLMVVLDEKSGDQVIKIHPDGNMDICTKFHGDPPMV